MKTEKRIRSFEDLIVWQMGIAIVKEIYLVTSAGLLKNDFGLKDQMRRASVSIPTNIAEGFPHSPFPRLFSGRNLPEKKAVRSDARFAACE